MKDKKKKKIARKQKHWGKEPDLVEMAFDKPLSSKRQGVV